MSRHMTVTEAQERLGISKGAMTSLITDGTLPTMRMGGHTVVAAIDADLLLDEIQDHWAAAAVRQTT